jgi:eukaryotic-like serine/threonine-protein kinase
MTPERWQEIKHVLDGVLELKPGERTVFLDRACANDASLRQEVEVLLAAEKEAETEFLNEPQGFEVTTAANSGGNPAEATHTWIGRRVGPYKVVEQIGIGGMGEVYRAYRADDQYRKEVALKVVRGGEDSGFVVNRFKTERQILASFDHPNIARLHDGGTTEDGVPYFIMELIYGQPIDQYCSDHKLSIAERLKLFLQVCSAVQYAHQRLIIHRDIKPTNILVASGGTPKLLDFGIAKILDNGAVSGQVEPTLTVFRLLTPGYASPEQIRGEPITTASDVYSLGVVLYELLTGHHPYRRRNSTPQEIAHAVCEVEPEKPSSAVRRIETTDSRRDSQSSSAGPKILDRSAEKRSKRLRGDLDNIVLMALRKEPQRRYASVEQFAGDIQRHLENLPVIARPDTVGYRTSKFITRHKAGVMAATVVIVILLVAMAITVRQARIARQQAEIARTQRARAERRFNDLRNLANSLMFDVHDAIRDLPGSTHARQLLVTNALKYLDSLAGEARGDLSLQRELADAYERVGAVQGQPYTASLGDTAGALKSYLKAQAIRKTVAVVGTAPDQIKYAGNCRTVAALQLLSADAAAAISSAQESVAITQALLKGDPANREALAELAADYSSLGSVFEESHTGSIGDQSAVEENYKKALEIDGKLAKNSTDRVRLRSVGSDEFHIGRHLRDAGYRMEAVEAFNHALGIFDGLAAGSNGTQAQRDVATVTSNMGDTFLMNGDAIHALANYRRSLNTATVISAADPNNGDARSMLGEANLNVGISLAKLGKRSEAVRYLLRAIAISEEAAVHDPQQEGVNWDLTVEYVWTASVTPDAKGALEDYQKALAIDQRLARIDTGTSDWRENEAEVHVKIGDFFRKNAQLESAAENYSRAAAMAEPILVSHADRQEARYALAGAYFGLGQIASLRAQRPSQSPDKQAAKWNEAKSWYQRSSDAWRQIRHPAAVSPNGFDCGDPEEAARQLARCNAALAELRSPQAF